MVETVFIIQTIFKSLSSKEVFGGKLDLIYTLKDQKRNLILFFKINILLLFIYIE
jgi:hypothetical protein